MWISLIAVEFLKVSKSILFISICPNVIQRQKDQPCRFNNIHLLNYFKVWNSEIICYIIKIDFSRLGGHGGRRLLTHNILLFQSVLYHKLFPNSLWGHQSCPAEERHKMRTTSSFYLLIKTKVRSTNYGHTTFKCLYSVVKNDNFPIPQEITHHIYFPKFLPTPPSTLKSLIRPPLKRYLSHIVHLASFYYSLVTCRPNQSWAKQEKFSTPSTHFSVL